MAFHSSFHFNWRKLIVAGLALTAFTGSIEAHAVKKKAFVCKHPDTPGGFGALDLGCDADQFGDVTRMKTIYPALIYDRRSDVKDDHLEYITNVNATIKAIAHAYYTQRIPDVKPHTLAYFKQTAVALGAHESKLSHYRIAKDGRYKLMTGDGLVSHGIMQVNQNFHADKDLDSSFDFVGNVVAGLDTYFNEWNRAIKKDCYLVSNKKSSLAEMLQNRARSAYSAYNGGPSKLCRYLDSKNHYRRHDSQFFETLHTRPYQKWVKDENRPAPVNVKCLMEGDDLCALAKPAARSEYLKERPLLLKDGRTCVTLDGSNMSCAADMRVFSCLAKINPDILDNDPLKLDAIPASVKVTNVTDRDALCNQAVKGLLKVGQQIVLKKEILLRESVGGSPIGNLKTDRVFQIVDYDVRLGSKTDRFYKVVISTGGEGWIYGGSNDDFEEWIEAATPERVVEVTRAYEAARAERAARREAKAQATPTPTPEPEVIEEIVVTAPKKDPELTEKTTGMNTNAGAYTETPAAPAPTAPVAEEEEEESDTQAVLPVTGSIISIVHVGGIPLRAEAGEDTDKNPIADLNQGARLTVEEVVTKESENRIYLKVTAGGKTGWIYAGRTVPTNTTSLWIKIWK